MKKGEKCTLDSYDGPCNLYIVEAICPSKHFGCDGNMSTDGGWNRRAAVLLALSMMLAVLATAGCLDSGEEEEEKLEVPDDRAGKTLRLLGVEPEGPNRKNVTIEEIVKMGLEDFEATFINSVGTTFTANYTGVLLRDLLDLVSPYEGVDVIVIRARDGYEATLFYADMDDDMYITLLEEGKWNDLSDAGVFRLVDTDLPSAYWVRDISSITVRKSPAIWTGGYTEEKWLINIGWILEHASQEVSWQEGEKTRTYTGVPMSEVLTAVGADDTVSDSLALGTMSKILEPTSIAAAKEHGVLLVDSRGRYVYFEGPGEPRVDVIERFYVGTLLTIDGEVGQPYTMDNLRFADNSDTKVPWENVTFNDVDYLGTPLSWLVASAAPNATADAVRIMAGDDYYAVFPLANLSSALLAFMIIDEWGSPLPLDLGPFRIIDASRPGPFHVGWVIRIEVFTSEPIVGSGLVNVSEIIDIGHIDGNADTQITYNDGRKDRTYNALTWDAVLNSMDANTTATTLKLVDGDGDSVEWDIEDLLDRADSGICVDSRGNYVAYRGDNDEAFFGLVSIVVS